MVLPKWNYVLGRFEERSTEYNSEFTFAIKGETEYELHKALEVGDVLSAFGQFKDHTTSKFSFNIKGPNNLYLIHVDFRPWINELVLNSNQPGVGWQAEVRPAFPKEKLVGETMFKVSVEVLEGEYRISYNDEEVGKFPQRQNISLASHIILHGGSNGFEWKSAQLPLNRILQEVMIN